MKKISIIIPVWNVEPYIHRCIDSVINQSYKNLEIILIDDGSPDNCPQICDEYAKKDNRITVIHKENGGQSSARNVGLDIATGDYIGFVDSDDFIHRDMYKILLESLEKNNCDISVCSLKKLYDKKNVKKINLSQNNQIEEILYNEENYLNLTNYDINNIKTKIYNKEECWYYSYINDNYVISQNYVWNKLYKKEVFNQLRFQEGAVFEDIIINSYFLYNVNKMVVVNLPLYFYYQENIHSTTLNTQKIVYNFYSDIEAKYVVINNIKNENINIKLKQMLFKKIIFLLLFRSSKLLIDNSIEERYKKRINEIIKDIYLNKEIFTKENFILKILLNLYIMKKYKILKVICVVLRSFHYEKSNFCIQNKYIVYKFKKELCG